jgi:hypothetical protein
MNEDVLKTVKGVANLLVLVFLATTIIIFLVYLADAGTVQCDNGAFIDRDWVNDGVIDCGDGSDESPAAEDWPSTKTLILFWPSLILLVIFGFLSLKIGKEVELKKMSRIRLSMKVKEEKLRQKRERKRQAEAAHLNYLREKARERERALDYDSAIGIWEELGEIEEAARVRKLKARQGSVRVAQKVVKGDEITKTEIKDSVISKSNIGGGGKSKAEQIKEIKELLDSGTIDAEDYQKMKQEIVG